MLSGTAEYALRAVLFLADHADRRSVPVGQVADALRLPHNYLSKILHELARTDVLVSARGKHGGFRLARPAGEISLRSIVTPFDRVAVGRTCLLGRVQCSDRTACAVHWRWKSLAEDVAAFFHDTTVADLRSKATVSA